MNSQVKIWEIWILHFIFLLQNKVFGTMKLPLRKKCMCSEFFWYVSYRIRTEYGDLRISVFTLNAEKHGPQNSEYFSRSVCVDI